MIHTILYYGRFSPNFDRLQRLKDKFTIMKPDNKGCDNIDAPSEKVDGIVFGYMQKSTQGGDNEQGFFAVKVENVILNNPVQLIPELHTDGKGFGPSNPQFGDVSAKQLLRDIISANCEQTSLLNVYEKYFECDNEVTCKNINHTEVIKHLLELGEIKGFKAHSEYPCDTFRLDTIWKAEFADVPKYCFEVHVAGNLYKDFAALKHAYDKWNAKVFLICAESNIPKAKNMTSGSFHEIKNKIEILNAQEFWEYCQFKQKFKDIDKLFD